jgi:hypothetical protein
MIWYILCVYLFYYKYTQYQFQKHQQQIYEKLKSIEKEMTQFDKLYPMYLTKHDIVEHETNIEHKLVEEETPDGVVWMTYDEFTKSFLYWSKKAVAYKYLETVARKYVIFYECKDCYVDKHTLEKVEEGKKAVFYKKKIVIPVLKNANIFKWVGKEYVKEEKKVVDIKPISYAEFIKNKNK